MDNRETLLELYKLARAESHKSIELHLQNLGRYLTLSIATFGATLTAMNFFKDDTIWQVLAAFSGGLIGVALAVLGRRICDRFYEGMLEGITMSAKLEVALEIEQRPEQINNEVRPVFQEDAHYLPERWVENRNEYVSGAAFVAGHMNSGSNQVARRTFLAFIALNGALMLISAYVAVSELVKIA